MDPRLSRPPVSSRVHLFSSHSRLQMLAFQSEWTKEPSEKDRQVTSRPFNVNAVNEPSCDSSISPSSLLSSFIRSLRYTSYDTLLHPTQCPFVAGVLDHVGERDKGWG